MKPATHQEQRRAKKATVISFDMIDLAPEAKARFFRGLERFVNTGSSLEDYKDIAKGWPSFWPCDLQRSSSSDSPVWSDAAHRIFLVYRDTLRRVWISDPEAMEDGSLSFLFGITDRRYLPRMHEDKPGFEAWEQLNSKYPDAHVGSQPVVYPMWRSGDFKYVPQREFQQALYLLFRESWRAKTCPRCSNYFVAQKAAQMYCSVDCSNLVHRSNALKWWNREGAKRRFKQANAGRKPKGTKVKGE